MNLMAEQKFDLNLKLIRIDFMLIVINFVQSAVQLQFCTSFGLVLMVQTKC